MKKGFTLVEFIAVAGLIAVIAVIFVPSLINTVDDKSNEIYKLKEKKIEEYASDYVSFEKDFKIEDDNDGAYILFSKLISKDYMSKVIDNDSKNECVGYVYVTENDVAGYDFDVCLICDEYMTDSDTCSYAMYQRLTSR